MNNIKNNKIIVYSLGILAILVVGVLIMPTQTHAYRQTTGCGEGGCNYVFRTPVQAEPTYVQPTQVVYSPAPTVYSTTYVAPKPAVKKVTVAKKVTPVCADTPTTATLAESNNKDNGLLASVIFGGSGFMPSGLIQWILLAIFILLIVILVRKVTGAEDRYHAEPLKHA